MPDVGDAAGEIGDGALAEQNKAGTVVLAGNTGDVSSDVDPGGGIGAEPAESDGTGNAGAGGEFQQTVPGVLEAVEGTAGYLQG